MRWPKPIFCTDSAITRIVRLRRSSISSSTTATLPMRPPARNTTPTPMWRRRISPPLSASCPNPTSSVSTAACSATRLRICLVKSCPINIYISSIITLSTRTTRPVSPTTVPPSPCIRGCWKVRRALAAMPPRPRTSSLTAVVSSTWSLWFPACSAVPALRRSS